MHIKDGNFDIEVTAEDMNYDFHRGILSMTLCYDIFDRTRKTQTINTEKFNTEISQVDIVKNKSLYFLPVSVRSNCGVDVTNWVTLRSTNGYNVYLVDNDDDLALHISILGGWTVNLRDVSMVM